MLDLAILGLLDEQPLHGYELKTRLRETLGTLWGFSFGSLYPALGRLQREGSIESVEPGTISPAMPSTGSLSGDLAAARMRRGTTTSRRGRKAYRITEHGCQRLRELLVSDDGTDDDRTFALKLAFCGVLTEPERIRILERRRSVLLDRADADGRTPKRGDRYARSLAEHRAESLQRDLEWVDALLATERAGDGTPVGASSEPAPAPSLATSAVPTSRQTVQSSSALAVDDGPAIDQSASASEEREGATP